MGSLLPDFDEYDSVTGKSQERQIAVNIGEQAEAEAPQTPPVSDHTRAGLGKLQDAYAKR